MAVSGHGSGGRSRQAARWRLASCSEGGGGREDEAAAGRAWRSGGGGPGPVGRWEKGNSVGYFFFFEIGRASCRERVYVRV